MAATAHRTSQESDVFRQPTTIAGFAISAVVAHAVLAQTPTTAAGESDDAVKRLEQFDQPENPVDNAESLVAIGEYPEAINIVELEIDKIERRSSRYNIDLARPLAILGDALAGVGDREGALGAYGRAVHITRVNRGLHHPSQVDFVYREAKVLAHRPIADTNTPMTSYCAATAAVVRCYSRESSP